MTETPPKNLDIVTQSEALKEAYSLLGASNPHELYNLYLSEDQKLMKSQLWDYDNHELVINKIKDILESADVEKMTEEEKEWRTEILWFWYHHAISCAALKNDREAAKFYAAKALEFQPEDHPNKITRLLSFLVNDQLDEAKKWAQHITEEPEKSTASDVIQWYEEGEIFKQE